VVAAANTTNAPSSTWLHTVVPVAHHSSKARFAIKRNVRWTA